MADYDVIDNVAVITCQNPPVNQLGERLRVGLFDGMKKGLANPNVDVIVIIGGGRTFPAGADITYAYFLILFDHMTQGDITLSQIQLKIHFKLAQRIFKWQSV